MMLTCACLSCAVTAQDERPRRGGPGNGGGSGGGGGGGSGLGNYVKPPPANDIPAHPCDIIVGRPTDRSVELRILQNADGVGLVEYKADKQTNWSKSAKVTVTSGQPVSVVLDALQTNTAYMYRWVFTAKDAGQPIVSDPYSFQTQRAKGSSFVFSVTADSHLDENSSGEVYTQTLLNARADRPDFHLELGDTFMTGKYVKPEASYGQYLAQRYYLSHLCNSSALFFVMGNHDGESAGRGSFNWATTTRKSLFPNPEPNAFYTGNLQKEPDVGYPCDYYAWQWGDAQFIVLDPYRYTIGRRSQGGGGQGGGQRGPGARGNGNPQTGPTERQRAMNRAKAMMHRRTTAAKCQKSRRCRAMQQRNRIGTGLSVNSSISG